jgi:solute carrier family 25 S-adenosylmethionine transporter 26
MANNTNTDILLAGAFAAFTVDLLVYPLDTLKTRFQSPDYTRLYTRTATNTINKPALFRGLYQGITSVVIATLPSSGAFFTTYEGAKTVFSGVNKQFARDGSDGLLPIAVVHSAASGLAELVSCAILTPAEVIKQNAQMYNSSDSSKPGAATRQTLQRFRHNPLALWRGYTALAGRNLPFTALQFPLFERLKTWGQEWRQRKYSEANGGKERKKNEIGLWENGAITAVAAGTAGSFAAVVTTPVDVIKTRIMLKAGDDGGQDEKSGKSQKGLSTTDKLKEGKVLDALGENRKSRHKGTWEVGKEVVKEQGWKGLFRGGALRAVWTMLGSGLYLGE